MRYETKVKFIKSGKELYDPETSEWKTNIDDFVIRWCSMYDLGTDRTSRIFGHLAVKAKVIHHLGKPVVADYVLIGDRRYNIVTSRELRHKSSYVLRES